MVENDENYEKYISPTALTVKIRCGRLYYYERILKLPKEENTVPLVFGNVTHSILENFYISLAENEEDAQENPHEYFMNLMEILKQQYWSFEIPQTKEKELDDILAQFVDKQSEVYTRMLNAGDTDKFFPLAVEKDIHSQKYKIRSIVDRINKNYTIGDYKTTKRFPELLLNDREDLSETEKIIYDKEALQYQIQAVMNAMCIEDEYGIMPSMMIFIFVRHLNNKEHGGLLPIPITQELVDKVVNLINIHTEEINNKVFLPTTDKSNCAKYGGCPYKEVCDSENVCWYMI